MMKKSKPCVPSRRASAPTNEELRRAADRLRQQVERDNVLIDVLRRAYRLPPYHLRLVWRNPNPPRPTGAPRVGYGPGAA